MTDVVPEAEQDGFSPAASLFDGLRQQYKELAEKKSTQLAIPGYSGKLIAQYRLIDVTSELKKITARIRAQYQAFEDQALYSTIDIMILSCEGLSYLDDDGVLRPLSDAFGPGEPPVKFDDRLATFLGFDSDNARDTVLNVFAHNQVAIIAHGQQLQRWMTTLGEQVSQEFSAGEG